MNATEVAKSICEHLPGYEPDLEHCNGIFARLRHESGDGRGLSINTQNQMWRITPIWPQYKQMSFVSGVTICSIQVNSSRRSPQSIAKDIIRKILPDYDMEYDNQVVRMEACIKAEESQINLRNQICEQLGERIGSHESESLQVTVYKHGLRQIHVSGDNVKLTTAYLPKDVVMEVIDLLKNRMSA